MEESNKNIGMILEEFRQLTKKPDCFLESNDTLNHTIKTMLKEVYDTTKSEEFEDYKSSALPELIIKNFDIEQIWQQIELQNDRIVSNSLINVSKLISNKESLLFSNLKDEIQKKSNESEGDDKVIYYDEGKNIQEDKCIDEEDNEDINESNSLSSESDVNELNLSDEDLGENIEEVKMYSKKSIVDDEFFNLNDMENFVKAEEKKTQNKDSGNDSDESNSEAEEDVNLFDSDSDEDDEFKTARFKDFFGTKEDNKGPKPKKDRFMDISNDDDSHLKSSLEKRQERLQKRIEEIEQNNINEKPWQLKGEITADNRPQNSLLEEVVEFDLSSRPAPIITEQTNLQLEDIIKQRIRDRAFDSVVRKIKPVETPLEYKKKLVLDQEKSKHSLSQIYEKEFLEKQSSLDPENQDKEEVEPELHKEIKHLMKNLFNKLDALSNFHFTPKPAIPELRVVNNLPAISLEEVAPVAASNAALLAPEEVRNKPVGEIVGKTERTSTDKNRERRKKKKKQRIHLIEKGKREKLKPDFNKVKSKTNLKQVIKDKNVEKMTGSYENSKSSKAFFTQLQEEVQTQISKKVKGKGTKKQKHHVEAKRMKL